MYSPIQIVSRGRGCLCNPKLPGPLCAEHLRMIGLGGVLGPWAWCMMGYEKKITTGTCILHAVAPIHATSPDLFLGNTTCEYGFMSLADARAIIPKGHLTFRGSQMILYRMNICRDIPYLGPRPHSRRQATLDVQLFVFAAVRAFAA